MSSTQDLLNRLKHFVKAEAEAQYSVLKQQWSQPLALRVAKGWAIEGISLVAYDEGLIKLHCDTNNSRFREGDLVVLHQDNPEDPEALHLELEYDGDTALEASLKTGNHLHLLANPSGWIMDQDFIDLSMFYLDALNVAADSLRGRDLILPLLQGKIQPKMDYARYERTLDFLSQTHLNESQIESIALAYATDLLHLIQGPPGTGKTLTLAYLAKLLIDDEQRVLITGLTHRSINNALNKISQVDPTMPVCKIGNPQQARDLLVENYENFMDSQFGDLHGGYAIGATPFARFSQRLSNVEFDTILFDEASQITLPLAIMGMLGGDKYIFFGDENQLPPVSVFSEQQVNRYTIFNFLAGRGDETMLNVTYRLNDILVVWPSKTFYQNLLVPSSEAAPRRLQLSKSHSRWDFVLDPTAPAVFLDLCHCNTTVRSRTEADTLVEIILALLTHGIPPEEIGVLVPFRAQSRLIRSLLRRLISDETTFRNIVVDTVERMQGQERDVMLVSFATSSLAFATQIADFLIQPQRLNVAVTRARTKLILIGSHHMFDEGPLADPDDDGIFSLLRSLIDHCYTITLPEGRLD